MNEFDCVRWNVPAIREDEILYSWIARIHFASYSRSIAWTMSRLFDIAGSLELKTLLPTHLEALSEWLFRCGLSIKPEDLILKLTSYKYFASLLSDVDAKRLRESMVRGSKDLKIQLGLVASRLGAGLTLKWCPDCTRDDVVRYGVPHWRQSHQLPGVLACTSHSAQLQIAVTRKRTFVLPLSGLTPLVSNPPWLSQSINFAKWSNWLTREFEGFGMPPHEYYRAQLRSAGYRRGRYQIQAASFEADIRDHYQDLRFLTATPSIDEQALRSFRWLPKLYRTPRGGQHPVFHLLLLSFLHELPAHAPGATALPASNSSTPHRGTPRDNQIGLLIELHAGGASSNAIAATLGVSVTTVVELARSKGLKFTSRAKKVTQEVRSAVTKALARGDSPASVMSSLSLSSTTVRRIIRADEALKGALEETRVAAIRDSKRQSLRCLADAGALSASGLVRLRPDLYSWFRRNDRFWLETQLTPERRVPKTTAPWRARDALLAAQVRAEVSALRSSLHKPKRISTSEIVRQCSASRWIPRSLAKLPLTAALLAASNESKDAFRIRLFVWTFHQMRSQGPAPIFWRIAKATGVRSSFWKAFHPYYEALASAANRGNCHAA